MNGVSNQVNLGLKALATYVKHIGVSETSAD